MAFSTACAPIAGAAHVNADRSDDAVQRQFIVNIDPEMFASNTEMNSKLETLSEGQQLAVDMATVTADGEPGLITFNLDADSAA
ncbi:MAG: hypothetical protein J4O01_10420, partial [Chloroflexi bacterium]|nr:hypothetical protein [Chloroflexota bacterium]